MTLFNYTDSLKDGDTFALWQSGLPIIYKAVAVEDNGSGLVVQISDADDENVKSKTNTLQEMISSDPDSVVAFFTQLGKSLNSKMKDLMGRTDYSSSNTVYDDKKMKTDYDSYTTKIKEAEEKLQDYEDKWYSKFSRMETALAKLQSNSSAITGLLGGS